MKNIDKKVVKDFGDEWGEFTHTELNDTAIKESFNSYFEIFPKEYLNKKNEGFDMGCGSGRWARIIANKVKTLNCIDPSLKALNVAKINLKNNKNINFFNASVDDIVLKENSQDFGYCLGVLHHIPNTISGIKSCQKILKPNAPMLIYLYYNFDNKPYWFKLIWLISNIFRKIISNLPFVIKKIISLIIAIIIYFPLAKISKYLEKIGFNVSNFPLSAYKNKMFYEMKNDSLDRFGTKLEKRYTQKEIKGMLLECGFDNIIFSKKIPFWTVLSYKK